MGNTPCSVERYARGSSTGMLTLSQAHIHSWSKLTRQLAALSTPKHPPANKPARTNHDKTTRRTKHLGEIVIRTLTLSENKLRGGIPSALMELSLWRTLRSVDLSKNGLRCACALGILAGSSSHRSGKHCLAAAQGQHACTTTPSSLLIKVASRTWEERASSITGGTPQAATTNEEEEEGRRRAAAASEADLVTCGSASDATKETVCSTISHDASTAAAAMSRSDGHSACTPANVMCYPLESLNLSYNDLALLPPHLCVRFPYLRRLVCTHNAQSLQLPILDAHALRTAKNNKKKRKNKQCCDEDEEETRSCGGGLMNSIGNGVLLELIDLTASHVRHFYLLWLGYIHSNSNRSNAPDVCNDKLGSALSVLAGAAISVFPALRELRLDENELVGTFQLCGRSKRNNDSNSEDAANTRVECTEKSECVSGASRGGERVTFPALRIIGLSRQQRFVVESRKAGSTTRVSSSSHVTAGRLCAVDPAIFDAEVCPQLTSVNVSGNECEEEIRDQLVKSPVYCRWRERNAKEINRQLASGLTVTPM